MTSSTSVQPLREASTSLSYPEKAQPLFGRKQRGLSRWSIFNVHYPEFRSIPGAHEFKDCLINENEEEKIQREAEKIRPFNKITDQYCIIAVGTTGVGKSSVVKLFCGDSVEISSSTISCTKESTIYTEIDTEYKINNRQWMDTQGTDDSDMEASDEKILKKVFKKLYEQKIRDIIILWLVSGDMDRQKGEYLKQASFISGFETKSSTSNIWSSTLIIQKMGQLQPKVKQILGVIDAAKHNGGKRIFTNEDIIHEHSIGFKCIDMINIAEDDMYQTLIENETIPAKMEQLGYVNIEVMRRVIHEKLQNINCFRLDFENKVCDKCSVQGDPRYLYYKCHYKPTPKHIKSLIPYHPSPLEYYHSLDTHLVHKGTIIHSHPGQLILYHPGPKIKIEIEDKENPIHYHSGEYETNTSGFLCCKNSITQWSCCLSENESEIGCCVKYLMIFVYERSGCCKLQTEYFEGDEYKHNSSIVSALDGEHIHVVIDGCMRKYDCCERKENGGKPCLSKWDCCGQVLYDSDGCQSTYLCCENNEGERGCQQRFVCCSMPDGARGCLDKYECCDKPPNSKGCETVCNRCGIKWGYRPGCSWPHIEDDDEDDDYAPDNYDDGKEDNVNNTDHIASSTVIFHQTVDSIDEENAMEVVESEVEMKPDVEKVLENAWDDEVK